MLETLPSVEPAPETAPGPKPFSWSASRHDTFMSCKRRYYYSYYASADDPEIFIGGQDGAQQALTLIKQGTMYRASSALAVRDLAAAVIQHPIDVANGGSKEDAQVPVRLITHDDTALLDEYLAQLTPEK